jgi:glutamine amidotransferase
VIGVIDCGIGNHASVHRMIQRVGGSSVSLSGPALFSSVDKVILPGVGHFDAGMSELVRHGFYDGIMEHTMQRQRPLLGICLGMQLLCSSSEEGHRPGIGLVNAQVIKFKFEAESKLKVPHMGWNTLVAAKDNPLLPISDEEQRFYFVHSYKVVPGDPQTTIALANHGGEFCAAFQKENIFGVQFHPEKSHRFGMDLMKRFVELK